MFPRMSPAARVRLAIAIALYLLLACSMVLAAEQPARKPFHRATFHRASWVWNNWIVETPEKQQDFLRFCHARRIDTIFIHAPADHLRERAAHFRSFLAAAHQRQMRVEALDGASDWAFTPAKPQEFLAAVLAFNRDSPPEERFDGVHLDVEPYDSPEWKASAGAAAAQYLEMLDRARQQVEDFPIAADVPPWFGEVEVPEGTLLSAAITRLNAVAVMAYTEQVKGLAVQARPAVEFAAGQQKQVWIGISAQLQDSDMDPDRPARPQVEAVIKAGERAFRNAPGLAGVAVHDYEHFRELYEGNAP
jgi:hypothetical protein